MGAHNTELRDQPAYTLTKAARYLKLPVATLRSWTLGRQYARIGETAHFRSADPSGAQNTDAAFVASYVGGAPAPTFGDVLVPLSGRELQLGLRLKF